MWHCVVHRGSRCCTGASYGIWGWSISSHDSIPSDSSSRSSHEGESVRVIGRDYRFTYFTWKAERCLSGFIDHRVDSSAVPYHHNV